MAITYFAPLMLDDYKLRHLEQDVTPKQEREGCLKTVFFDGEINNIQTIYDIRDRVFFEYINK